MFHLSSRDGLWCNEVSSAITHVAVGRTGLQSRYTTGHVLLNRVENIRKYQQRLFWMVLAAWIALAGVGWLVVVFTDVGLLKLSWAILPIALISLFVVLFFWVAAVSEARREALQDLGFEVPDAGTDQQIVAAVESMFDASTSVEVLGTKVIVPDGKCWVAEVNESLIQSSPEDNGLCRRSTVCLFEHTGEPCDEQHSFRLQPHNRVDRMLLRGLSHWFSHSTGSRFHLWYDAVSSEESGLNGILTSDMREWLGRHSLWSKMRAWTVVNSQNGTLIYRAGTVYEKEKYPQFVSEMQVFAELRAEATISGSPMKASDCAPSEAQRLLHQLVDQEPVRQLATYWRKKTRAQPFTMVVFVFLLTISVGVFTDVFAEYIMKITGIVLKEVWLIVFAGLLWGLFVFLLYRQCFWQHRRNRKLLKTGHVAYGTVEHCKRNKHFFGDANEYRVHVVYYALDATHTANWSLFVDYVRLGVFSRSAKEGQEVIVLYNPTNPRHIVLPELLAASPFCI
jgi:hypothetical protein